MSNNPRLVSDARSCGCLICPLSYRHLERFRSSQRACPNKHVRVASFFWTPPRGCRAVTLVGATVFRVCPPGQEAGFGETPQGHIYNALCVTFG
jgi:hypothetical protein